MADTSRSPLDTWLEGLGFVRGDPFATVTAEHERSVLPMFFVHVDGYDLVKADRSVVVFAPRGCGKSALRVQLASDAAPARPEASRLAVEYTDFDPVIAVRRAGRSVTADDHIPWLLRAGVGALFEALCGAADAAAWAGAAWLGRAERAARIARLGPADRARLAQLIRRYAPQLLDPDRVAATLSAVTPYPALRLARDAEELRALITGPEFAADPLVALLADLLALPPIATYPETPTESVASLVRVARAAGFVHVQFLVDRLDEYGETANRPGAQADLVECLLAHLPLLELPSASFKFFLAHETRNALVARPAIRRDRVGDYSVTITWSQERLKQLLDERLSVFSDSAVSELIQICEEGPAGVVAPGAQIERELLTDAHGSPRRLLLAGQLMLQAHIRRAGPVGLLSLSDWAAARAALLQRMPPTIHVQSDSRAVKLGGQALDLSPMLFNVLMALAHAGGPCTRDELARRAWGAGEGVSNEAINKAVSRLREALNDDARHPVYIKVDRQSDTIELCHAELE